MTSRFTFYVSDNEEVQMEVEILKNINVKLGLPAGTELEGRSSNWLESAENSVKEVEVKSELEACSRLKLSGERYSSSNFTADIAKFIESYVNQSSHYWHFKNNRRKENHCIRSIIIPGFPVIISLGNPRDIQHVELIP